MAGRDRQIDAYTAANHDYKVRLAVVRSIEEGQAALVAVWLTLGLSAVFVSIGGGLMFRMRRRERERRELRAAERAAQGALPDTDRRGAIMVAEKIRVAMRGLQIRGLEQSVTASLGVATLPDDAADVDRLIRVADRAPYRAKQLGRDRVEIPTVDSAQPTYASA